MSRPALTRLARHRLTLTSVVVLLLLLLTTLAALSRLLVATAERDRRVRERLFDRDLHGFEGLFDQDTGYVLDHNLAHFLDPLRPVAPLLLPRSYYVARPRSAPAMLPERTPINCSLALQPVGPASRDYASHPDRLCAYFAADPGSGRYLYVTMTFVDRLLAHPRAGGGFDPAASGVRLSVGDGADAPAWWLQFDTLAPPAPSFEPAVAPLRAYRAVAGGTPAADAGVEGWVYLEQPESEVRTVTLDARIDLAALDVADAPAGGAAPGARPAPRLEAMRIGVARRYLESATGPAQTMQFGTLGETVWSLPALLASFFDAHADVSIRRRLESGERQSWVLAPSGVQPGAAGPGHQRLHLENGDLVFQSRHPRHLRQAIPNTRLSVELVDPGIVIQNGVWQTTLLVFLVLLGFLGLAAYVFVRVLRPIAVLSMQSRQLVPAALRVTTELPYGERNDEIGTLSTAFSDLLRETRERAEQTRRQQAEQVRARELNLKTIGHEIRSPLQALLGLHAPGDPSRHYIDRMVRAVKYLFTGTGPQAMFDSVPLVLEQLDVARFLAQLVANTASAGIPDVRYDGPASGVVCLVDPNALEDAVSHVLANANRHRRAGTPIVLRVAALPAEVCIGISNEGENIPEEFVERIFDLHFSQAEGREESNQGLGLFVARNYVSRMSGSVAVRNHVSGVSFEIRLPVSRL